MFRLTYALTFSAKIRYVLIVLDLYFDFFYLCFDFPDHSWVWFDFMVDLNLLHDRGTLVGKLKLLDFKTRNINRASRLGKHCRHFV